jgi:hypothetical protein
VNFWALERAWVCQLVAVKHMLIIQIPCFIDCDSWLFGLDHYSDSAVQGWPCTLKKVVGYDAHYCVFKSALRLPELVTIFNVENVFARPVAWRSWARQRRSFTSDAAKEELKAPAVRLFATGPRETLLVCSARKAFWGLQMTFLSKLASHCLIDVGVVTGLCSVLFAMAQKILDATDEETIQVLAQRLAWNDIESRFTGHLLQVDEAIACMDQADAKLITDEQKDAEDQRAAREVFVRD